MKLLAACGFTILLLLSGCTVMVIAYYYRQADQASRWACVHGSGADRCTLKVADGEIDVSSLAEFHHASDGDVSGAAAEAGQYGVEVHIAAGKAPLTSDLLKTHLMLQDDVILAPITVTETDEVADMGRQNVAADPQLIPTQQQRSFELRFAMDSLPDAYILSFAPLSGSGKQHAPPLLAMRIQYGSD